MKNRFNTMTTVTVNQIESQFVHLSVAEQSALLERLVQQSRVAGADQPGLLEAPLAPAIIISDVQHESERTEEFRAAEADLLSEVG